jgi:hypothetical protein
MAPRLQETKCCHPAAVAPLICCLCCLDGKQQLAQALVEVTLLEAVPLHQPSLLLL